MKDYYLLECSVDSVESAIEAEAGGANRLELCGNLIIGGTTPGLALFEEVKKQVHIPVYVLIRPRFGDFLYTEYEADIICKEIMMFKEAGADGVVIGSLKKDGSLNLEQMKRFMDCAKGMAVTLHRAFDVCKEPLEAMEQAISLGISTILTSGQAPNCTKGIAVYNRLMETALGRIQILAGAGVDASSITNLLEQTNLQAFHMSGKEVLESEMEFRNPEIYMGLPGISEYSIWRTNRNAVRKVREILDGAEFSENM